MPRNISLFSLKLCASVTLTVRSGSSQLVVWKLASKTEIKFCLSFLTRFALLLDESRLWKTKSKICLSCSTPTPPSVIQKPKSMRSHAHSSTHYSSIKMQFRFRHSKNKSERKYGRERRGKRIKSDPDVPILFRMHRRSHFMHRILKLHAVVFLAKLVLFMMIVGCSILCILFTW